LDHLIRLQKQKSAASLATVDSRRILAIDLDEVEQQQVCKCYSPLPTDACHCCQRNVSRVAAWQHLSIADLDASLRLLEVEQLGNHTFTLTVLTICTQGAVASLVDAMSRPLYFSDRRLARHMPALYVLSSTQYHLNVRLTFH
jgi:hypothetical protein